MSPIPPRQWQFTIDRWAEKDEKSASSTLSGDVMIPMIMANDRQPVISYSHLTRVSIY